MLSCAPHLDRALDPTLFKALGDPNRVALVCRLAAAARPMTVSEATSCCGIHLSGVSRHLAQLRQAGIVTAERDGREVRYRLDTRALAATLRSLADALEGRCC